jgi:cullin 3
LIRNLIDLHDRFWNIVKENFNQDPIFHKALKDAFEDFINKEYYTSNLLARYANDILKKGAKVIVSDLDTTMDNVVMIYGYIRDKDIFEKDYQQFLARRLLEDLSQSEQAERSMIGKLKTESGYHWTSKLEDMFKDIQRSKELMVEFNKSYGKDYETELSVSVCTTGSWPSSSIPAITQPPEVGPIADKFKAFYLTKYSGRRLSYQWEKGKADVTVAFSPKVTKILTVSTYQMLILLAFNRSKTLSFADLAKATNIPRRELIIHTLSMVHPKVKVLRKNPNTKDIEDDHKLQLNPKYTNPRAKVPVPVLLSVSPTAATDKDHDMDAINLLRRHQMDAAIVRIMKARKTLKHHDLVSEVVKQLQKRFVPKPVDIKKRIANLIELEYLERDAGDRQTYHYRQ